MLGDFLYELTPKDLQSIGMQLFTENSTDSVAAAAVSEDIAVPDERILVVQRIFADADGGGGQTVVQLEISRLTLTDALNSIVRVISGAVTAVAAHDGPLYLAPGEIIRATGSFSAGVAANQVRLFVHGYTIPRGVVNV
jgi:hypothetical protein